MMKGKNMDAREFWSRKYGQSAVYDSISLDKFEQISACLRFDCRSSRNQSDKLAPIRDVFEKFIKNCQRFYCPSEQVTVDEQLVTFRGRCSFKMFIPSKPGRYGLKIWALCDSKNSYLYNARVYLGKENGKKETNQGENIVKYLCQPIYKSERNVTTDNFFTSLSLARFLLGQQLTIVGTVRKNKRFLTDEFQSNKGKKGEAKFLFNEKVTLVKYNPKKNRSVVLLSTLHHERGT